MPSSQAGKKISLSDYPVCTFASSYCSDVRNRMLSFFKRTRYLFYFLAYLFTYSMQQSPSWEANRSSAIQEIPGMLWNPKVHYSFRRCPPPVPILSQLDPVPTPHPTFWRSILILSSHLHLFLPSGLFPSGFPTKTLYTPLLSYIRATFPVSLILLDLITRVCSRYWKNILVDYKATGLLWNKRRKIEREKKAEWSKKWQSKRLVKCFELKADGARKAVEWLGRMKGEWFGEIDVIMADNWFCVTWHRLISTKRILNDIKMNWSTRISSAAFVISIMFYYEF
jgi:hypothetical protein